MKNTTTEQKSMKNIEVMKNITAMEKTAIEKTTTKNITAKITTALLFFLAFFSLTTCLVAQESGQTRKQGWFVGVSPYFLGAEIKTTTENTTLTEIYTEGTRNLEATSVTLAASTTDRAEGANDAGVPFYSSDYGNRAISAVEDICKDGNYDGTTGDYYPRTFDVISNTMPTTTTGATDACYNHFQELAASFSQLLTGGIEDSTSSLSFSTTSENTPLNGNGLQFGYNFEKFRVSLNSHLWSAGESKLDSQLLLLDYFLPYGLYAGGGFGTAKLDTSIGSASKTAPALHFGYQHNFTNNFSLEVGLLWFGASFSLEKSAAAPEATISDIAIPDPDPIVSSALVGGSLFYSSPILNNVSFVGFLYLDMDGSIFSAGDRRILVTGTITPTYGAEQSESKTNETPPKLTKTTHELEAPTSLFIRFVWKFR